MAIFSVVIATAPPPGQGAEAGGGFLKIDGREALLRSVELFLNRDPVKQVQLKSCSREELEEAKPQVWVLHLGFAGSEAGQRRVALGSSRPPPPRRISCPKQRTSSFTTRLARSFPIPTSIC